MQAEVLILRTTCRSALLSVLQFVGSNEKAQVCTIQYMCEHEQCWNMTLQCASGASLCLSVISLVAVPLYGCHRKVQLLVIQVLLFSPS